MTDCRDPGPVDPLKRVQQDFPILHLPVNGHRLAYLDNAATTQKPLQVLRAMDDHYTTSCSNVRRGVHTLSQRATAAFDAARGKIRRFINAAEDREIVIVRGTTEGINLVARCLAGSILGDGDEVVITGMEHHSNIVPWQMLKKECGVVIRIMPVDGYGEVNPDDLKHLINRRTKLVSLSHVGNVLGTVNDVCAVVETAHSRGVPVMLDGAQAAGHRKVDVTKIGCDLYAFSGHKMYGPTGVGVLYGRAELLESFPPYQGGGDMIRSVSLEGATYDDIPHRLEAGTPDIAGVIGLAAAIDYLTEIGLDRIEEHEAGLTGMAREALAAVPGVRLLGRPGSGAGMISFLLDQIHPHDVGTVLDSHGVAVRAGHHCAQPLIDSLGVSSTLRASFGLYNSIEDIEAMVAGLHHAFKVFS